MHWQLKKPRKTRGNDLIKWRAMKTHLVRVLVGDDELVEAREHVARVLEGAHVAGHLGGGVEDLELGEGGGHVGQVGERVQQVAGGVEERVGQVVGEGLEDVAVDVGVGVVQLAQPLVALELEQRLGAHLVLRLVCKTQLWLVHFLRTFISN